MPFTVLQCVNKDIIIIIIKYFLQVYDQCTAAIHIQYTSFGINFNVDSN